MLESMPWWAWPILLFAVTFLLGVISVIAGVGGGVLFVPIVGELFPFHLDFVRGAGLLLALAGTLAAAPLLLRAQLAHLRLVMPLALAGSIASLAGAVLPILAVPSVLGVTLGSRIGARLLRATPAAVVRRAVIVVLLLSGLRALSRGLGLWI